MARRTLFLPLLGIASLVASCGGGGGGGDGGCNPASFVQLTYKDARIPDSQTSYSSGHEWFATLESLRFNPVHGDVCDATTTYRLVSGSLPAGVTLDAASGVIAGTPSVSGSYTPTIGMKVSGFSGEATTRMDFVVDDFSASYAGANTVGRVGISVGTITPVLTEGYMTDITGTTVNSNARRGSLLPAGASTVYTITAGSLPPGLALDTATGTITGTPTTAGSFVATIRVTASKDGASLDANPPAAINFNINP